MGRLTTRVALAIACAGLAACSAISIDDECQEWTKECEAMEAELKGADAAKAKKVYESHKDALVKKKKAIKDATHWMGMSKETNKAYNDCRGNTKSMLASADPKLGADYDDVLK